MGGNFATGPRNSGVNRYGANATGHYYTGNSSFRGGVSRSGTRYTANRNDSNSRGFSDRRDSDRGHSDRRHDDRDHDHRYSRSRGGGRSYYYSSYPFIDTYPYNRGYGYGYGYNYGSGAGLSYYDEPRYSEELAYDDGLDDVAEVQSALKRRGYYRGAIDGQIGVGSRAAIRAYQRDHRLPITSEVDNTLLRSLGLL